MADQDESLQSLANNDASRSTPVTQRHRPRNDNRDFTDPSVLRGIIQGFEEKQRADAALLVEQQETMRRMESLIASLRNAPASETARPDNNGLAPTIEGPDATNPNPPRTSRPRSTSDSRFSHHYKKTELTEKIAPLKDGDTPTFRQWRASVQDRLEVNADHYPTSRSRKALIWGATAETAKEYLEPQYLSDTETFLDADDMIELLATYFLSGNETEAARNAFHDLVQGVPDSRETFPQFKARFQSTAIQGNVGRSEWFHYLWMKISPALRHASYVIKITWNHDYQVMVQHLTHLDMERRRNMELNPSFGKKTTTPLIRKTPGSDPTFHSSASSGARQPTPFQRSGPSTAPFRQATTSFRQSTPFSPKPQPASSLAVNDATGIKCYGCGKYGHIKTNCPDTAQVHLLAREEREDHHDRQESHEEEDSEEFQEENDEA